MSGLGAQPLAMFAEPMAVLFLVFPLTNAVMLLSPLIVFGPRDWAPLLAIILLASGLMPLALPRTLTGEVFVGFYLWITSFFLMSAGCVLLKALDASQQTPGRFRR